MLYIESYMDCDLEESKETNIVKRLSDKKIMRLSKAEYAIYLKQMRIHDEAGKINNLNVGAKRLLHPILRAVMKTSRTVNRIKVCKLNTVIPKPLDRRPIIFVITHVGKDDIMIFNEVVMQHYTILSGDYESLHNRIEGFISMLNGTIFFDMQSVNERKTVEDRVTDVLKQGDNVLCSMEAAWNLSSNELVQELFPGMLRAAFKGNAVIIPVGLERFHDRLFGINVATKYFDPKSYTNDCFTDKGALGKAKKDLRQELAELKFELYFHKDILPNITMRRKDVGEYRVYEEWFKNDILKNWTFTEQMVDRKRYKKDWDPNEAFSYVINRFSRRLNLLRSYENSKNNNFDLKILLANLASELKNPVYPNRIYEKLEQMYMTTYNLL